MNLVERFLRLAGVTIPSQAELDRLIREAFRP